MIVTIYFNQYLMTPKERMENDMYIRTLLSQAFTDNDGVEFSAKDTKIFRKKAQKARAYIHYDLVEPVPGQVHCCPIHF